MIIALSGFMGCGKSSVASLVASLTGCFFFDLDDTIELQEGLSISEIFHTRGEAAFRQLEFEYLDRILSDYADFQEDMIISLGGGTVLNPSCAALLGKHAKCVYLRAGVDELVHNLEITGVSERPLLCNCADLRSRVEEMIRERSGAYEAAADRIIDVDGVAPEEVAKKISRLFFKKMLK